MALCVAPGLVVGSQVLKVSGKPVGNLENLTVPSGSDFHRGRPLPLSSKPFRLVGTFSLLKQASHIPKHQGRYRSFFDSYWFQTIELAVVLVVLGCLVL